MKDTQLYSQILGIKAPWSVDAVDLQLASQKVTVSVSFDQKHSFLCPLCSKKSPRYDKVKRQWRHLDTCQFDTIIEAEVPRVNCEEHGIHQVVVPWAEPNSRYTMMFECIVLAWLQEASVAAVASQMRLDWDAVHGIQKRAVERGLSRREAISPKDITIDETSEKKGHKYLTVVSEGSRVLYVTQGRDADSLNNFWGGLSESSLKGIRSISVDLWKPYISSVVKNVPEASKKLCLDRYHAAGYYGKALDEVRKMESRELAGQGDERLKNTKYDWLRTSSKIDNRSRKDFLALTRSTLKTARAWAIKETAHMLWKYQYIGSAKKGWLRLISWMKRCRLTPVMDLARTIENHLWMILNAVRLKATSGCAEGNNSRIQKVKRLACGFRNTENFKNAVYFHLGGLDMMPRFSPT